MTIREATKNILSSLNIYLNICDESIEDYLDIDDNIVAAIDAIAVQNTNSSFGIFVNNLKYIIYNYEIDFINDDTYSISGKKTIIDFHQSNLNGKSRLFAFADNDFSFVSLNLLTHRNVQTSNANDMLFSFKCLYDFLICDAAQNSYTVLMDLINNSSVYGFLTKKRTENINDIRDYSYVYMSFLNNSKHIIMASELEYNNMVLSSSLQYDENKKYEQYFDIYDVVNDLNQCHDILNRFLKLYHVMEYLVYRVYLVKLVARTGTNKIFIREFIKSSKYMDNNEKKSFTKNFEEIFIQDLATIQARITRFRTPNINSFVSNKFQVNNFLDIRGIADLIYSIRCSIVHNKESEFHLTLSNKEDYDIIIDLIKEIINLFEDLIMQKISTDHVSINYPQEKLNLY